MMTEKILITGGTGFIGSHTVFELLKEDRELVLLVRDMDKALRIFGERENLHFHKGDILDLPSLISASEGCTSLIHCAAMVTLNLREERTMHRVNEEGSRNIVNLVKNSGIRRVLYVSSCVTRFHPQRTKMDRESSLQRGFTPYARSKARAEKIMLSLNREDVDLYITYPSSVIGPDDPELSEANNALIYMMRFAVPLCSGGFQFIDVRDLARIHAGLLKGTAQPGLYMAGGHYFNWSGLHREVQRLSSRNIPRIPIPGTVLRLVGRVISILQRLFGFTFHLTYEGALYMTRWNRLDDRITMKSLGLEFRPARVTLEETAEWLRDQGFIRREFEKTDQGG